MVRPPSFRWPLSLLLSGLACTPAAAPPVVAPPAPLPVPRPFVEGPPELVPGLPPMPAVVNAPLQLVVRYPEAGQTLAVRDSNFLLGSVGSGDVRLVINGTEVPVAPNGAFLAWLPVPPADAPRYALLAVRGGDTARLEVPVRFPGRARLPAGALVVDQAALAPEPGSWARPEAYVRVAVRAAEQAAVELTILAGSEVDILADGRLDYDDETLATLDLVVASPHTALRQSPEEATARLLKAISHPAVRILGHPTGRITLGREGLSPDLRALVEAARTHDVALEINAHPARLDLRDTHVRAAIDGGALLSINCDTHAREDLTNARYGVLTARRGWATADRIVNCWGAERLHAWIRRAKG